MRSTETFVNPSSVLAYTARQMVAAHAGGAGPSEGMTNCPVCGELLPCPSGQAAAEVLFAAGLAQSSGLVAASQHGLRSPLGLPEHGPRAGGSPFPAVMDAPKVSFVDPPRSEPAEPVAEPVAEQQVVQPAPVGPDELPVEHELPVADVPIKQPLTGSPTLERSRWTPGRKAAKPSALRAPEAPPPAETARGSARPVLEPVVPEPVVPAPEPEIDPLLLGPPLFVQQNRPLDAPRFTRKSRPAEQSAEQPAEPFAVTRQDLPPAPQPPGQVFAGSGLPDVFSTPQESPDPSRAGGGPAASSRPAQSRADHPGAPDHPGEPGHPGVLDHPAEPHQLGPASPPAGRSSLEPPQMSQLNRGPAPDTKRPAPERPAPERPVTERPVTERPVTERPAPERPVTERGTQTRTTRQARPPLVAPQLGQLNRPVQPAGLRPIGDDPAGSGLPGRPAKAANVEMLTEDPAMNPAMQDQPAPWTVGQEEATAPSGLTSPPPGLRKSPETEQPTADEDVPSGLPHRTDLP